MVCFSNGQRESSHSGDSSSSDSDSEEQRFYARVNRSQRQQSSSTSSSSSDSSSDSDHEEVSTRPAAEKPAAPPSPKKNFNSSDRSAVRNQSNPSEPNSNTPTASKPKKAAAAKRAKVDEFAESRCQRQQSSSISACSSDSEHEEVSNRPVAEKPAAPPSPKKNPNSLDRSAVRKRKTPSTKKASVSNHIPSKVPVSNHIPAKDPASNHIPVKPPLSSTAIPNNKPEDRVDCETIMKETLDILAGVTRDVKKIAETADAELKALLDSHLSSANEIRGTGGASGRRINSEVWVRNRDPSLDGIYYLRELPPLDGARARILEGKWREVEILETQASLKRYALLHEECIAHLESMKTTGGNFSS